MYPAHQIHELEVLIKRRCPFLETSAVPLQVRARTPVKAPRTAQLSLFQL